MLRKMIVMLVGAAPLVLVAQEARPPSDVELRAAYCLAVDNAQLAVFTSNRTAEINPAAKEYLEKQVSALTSDIARLNAYVLPKLQYLDQFAIAGAASRGRADVETAVKEAGQCMSAPNPAAAQACELAAPAGARTRACKGATFLPY